MKRKIIPWRNSLGDTCRRLGISLRDCAERSGVSHTTIERIAAWEYCPPGEMLYQIARGLGTTVEATFFADRHASDTTRAAK